MLVTLQDADGAILATRELPCNALVENGAQGFLFISAYTRGKYVYTISFSGITDEYLQLQTLPCLSEGELGALMVNAQARSRSCTVCLFISRIIRRIRCGGCLRG
ncbi:MAG: hypothetical protein ACLU3N_10115 [Lachnospiraceae bacterium]